MFRPDTGVVQTSRDRVRRVHLTGGVLQEVAQRPMQHAGRAFGERGGMVFRIESLSGSLYSDELNRRIVNKRVKGADRIRPAAHARNDGSRKSPSLIQHLLPGFAADDRLKVAHHPRVGRRTDHRTDHIV